MEKAIKFNLICDGESIRTIEDLRKHFSIEDVLSYFKEGFLCRWLKVRGFNEHLEKVKQIDKMLDDKMIVKELIKIFEIEIEDPEIDDAIRILSYEEEKRKANQQYLHCNSMKESMTNDYVRKYNSLVSDILDNPEDANLIKTNIDFIMSDYELIFKLDYRSLFYSVINKSLFAVLYLLTYGTARNVFLAIDEVYFDENGNYVAKARSGDTFSFPGASTVSRYIDNDICDTLYHNQTELFEKERVKIYNNIISKIYKENYGVGVCGRSITTMQLTDDFKKLIECGLIKKISLNTMKANYNIDLSNPLKSCMVIFIDEKDIQIDDGNQSYQKSTKRMLTSVDVNGKFKIMNGIIVQTTLEGNNEMKKNLYYMEV